MSALALDAVPPTSTAMMTAPNGSYESPLGHQQPPPNSVHTPSPPQRSTSATGAQPGHQQQAQPQTQTQTQTPPLFLQHQLAPQQHVSTRASVKRPRPVKSCTECRKRKLRCDRLCPCSQCQKAARACKYAADHDTANLSDTSDAEASADPGRQPKRACTSGPSGGAVGVAGTFAGTAAGDGGLGGPVRSGETSNGNVVEELLARLERMEKQLQGRGLSLTDDHHGKAIPGPPVTVRGTKVKYDGMRSRFFGQNSARVMINVFDDAKQFLYNSGETPNMAEILHSFKKLHQVLQEEYRKSLMPITVFVDSMMPVQKRMTDILPKRSVCDHLVATYLESSEAVCRLIHVPTFYEHYTLFWEGKMQEDFFLPMLLCILSLASRFETRTMGFGHERTEGVHIPTTSALIRTWLGGLKGKQVMQLTTLQIELLLVIVHKMIAKRYQEVWVQLGSVVRLAMSMGLHRDPSESGDRISVFVGEIRRRLWYSVVDLDIQLALDCNLPSSVHPGDFSCQPPQNLDDVDIYPSMKELPPGRPIDQYTDTQGQVFTAALLQTRLRVTQLVNRVGNVDQGDEVIEVGQKLQNFLEDANVIFPRHSASDATNKHRQYRFRHMLDLQVRRPLMALYRPYALASPTSQSEISRAYLRSCLVLLGQPDELEPDKPHRQYITDYFHQIFRYDIIQAALSVLYYVQCMTRAGVGSPSQGLQAIRMSPSVGDDTVGERSGGIQIYSPARLLNIVESSLGVYIRTIHRGDTKAIVLMATVMELVKTANPRPDDVAHSLRSVLDRCLRAANVNLEKLTKQNAASSSAQGLSLNSPSGGGAASGTGLNGPPGSYQPETYAPSRSTSFMYDGGGAGVPLSAFGFDGWDLWEGWD